MKIFLVTIIMLLAATTLMHGEEMELTQSDLKKCTFEDPGAEPIWKFYVSFIDRQSGQAYSEKEFQALSKLPSKLRDACLLLRYELEWGNGGTQGAALWGEDIENSTKMLKMTASAYGRYGDKQREKMMHEIIGKLAEHAKSLDEADRNNTLDSYVSPLDKYDELWENVDYDYVEMLIKDMTKNPKDYTYTQ